MTTAKKLARELHECDLSQADEVPMQKDGHRAFDAWLASSRDAGDTDTKQALLSVGREAFASAWNELTKKADDS